MIYPFQTLDRHVEQIARIQERLRGLVGKLTRNNLTEREDMCFRWMKEERRYWDRYGTDDGAFFMAATHEEISAWRLSRAAENLASSGGRGTVSVSHLLRECIDLAYEGKKPLPWVPSEVGTRQTTADLCAEHLSKLAAITPVGWTRAAMFRAVLEVGLPIIADRTPERIIRPPLINPDGSSWTTLHWRARYGDADPKKSSNNLQQFYWR